MYIWLRVLKQRTKAKVRKTKQLRCKNEYIMQIKIGAAPILNRRNFQVD